MQRHKTMYNKCFACAVHVFSLSTCLASSALLAAEQTSKPLPKTLTGGAVSDPNLAGNLIQTTLGLIVVLIVIGAAAWAFKRVGGVNIGAQGRMKIIGGISLGTRERAVLLQVGEQQLLVGVAPGRVQTLHVLETPVPVDEKQNDTNSFSARLQTAILQRKMNKEGDAK